MTAGIRQPLRSELSRSYAGQRQAITKRLEEFSKVAPADHFYELAYCLLTPQSSAENAERAVGVLRLREFREAGFDPEWILSDRSHYIRFHKTKAKRLLRLRTIFGDVQAALESYQAPIDCRLWLVKNVDGLGLKEATHFLRNIGRNGDLAILDRHILRNLKRYGVLRSIPRSLSGREYLRIEVRFHRFARAIGIPINHLDLLFWSRETGLIRK